MAHGCGQIGVQGGEPEGQTAGKPVDREKGQQRAGQDQQDLNISITDDGRGMSPEILAWINSPEPKKRDGHLGLYNIMRILKLYYGNEYGLKAEVTEDGTTVTLRLPDVRSGSFGAERP